METVTVMPDTSPVPPVTPTTVNVVDTATLDRALADIRNDLARATVVPAGLTYASPSHPLGEFRSLVDYADAVYSSADAPAMRELLHRALVDQVTTEQPGVIPPGWVNTVYGIMEASRPLVEAFGTEPLPPAGMDVNWPYFDGNLLDLVGEQATEKTSITSVKVILEKGSADLHTLAGGSDISYQLIRRSAPSYRDAYLRIMFAAYAAVSDDYAAGMLLAVPGRGHVVLDPLTATADASSLTISVSGLPIIEDPFLPAGSLHVSNGSAASWYEEGPATISAPDVERLGENVAVWGMGTFGAQVPAGIVQVSATAPVTSGNRRTGKVSKD